MPIDGGRPRQAGLALLVILLGAIFVFGSHPASANLFTPPLDKAVHLMVFALLAIAIKTTWPNLNSLAVVAISAAVGLADELHQILVPGRQPGWADGLADLIGACCGLIVLKLYPWKHR